MSLPGKYSKGDCYEHTLLALEKHQKHQNVGQNPRSRHTIFTLCLSFICLSLDHNQDESKEFVTGKGGTRDYMGARPSSLI